MSDRMFASQNPWNDMMLGRSAGGSYVAPGTGTGISAPMGSFTSAGPGGAAFPTAGAGAAGGGGIGGFLSGLLGGGEDGGGGAGFGVNAGTGRLALGALGAAGSLWQSWQANQMAQKSFNFQRDLATTNLNNNIRSYNTALEDRARSRAVTEGQTDAVRDDYIARNRLAR